ncbi:type VII secretion target [Micromonospora sp. NPDC048170]|uniref:type VII secretion target n=1 Tax=Micromonospora sp. NPDC048170 TaxID=3154819 RepID=UPI0033FA088B
MAPVPPGDGIHVRPEDLTAHAGRLDQVAGRLDTANRAGQHVRLGTHAYGQLCALVPMLLDDLQRTLVDGIGTAAGSVRDTAERLRVGAERYRAADTRAAQLLDQVRRTQ